MQACELDTRPAKRGKMGADIPVCAFADSTIPWHSFDQMGDAGAPMPCIEDCIVNLGDSRSPGPGYRRRTFCTVRHHFVMGVKST